MKLPVRWISFAVAVIFLALYSFYFAEIYTFIMDSGILALRIGIVAALIISILVTIFVPVEYGMRRIRT